MKILVYTLGLPNNQTFSKRKEILDKKSSELKTTYPALNIMVIPGPENEGDKVFVADMTYYGPTAPTYVVGGMGVAGYGGPTYAGGPMVYTGPTVTTSSAETGWRTKGSTSYTVGAAPNIGPVTGSVANVVHYMDDKTMFKMDAGPSGFDFVNGPMTDAEITTQVEKDVAASASNPLGENVIDFKSK